MKKMPKDIDTPVLDSSRENLTEWHAWGRVIVLAIVLSTFVMALKPIRSPDVWHHIASGRLVAERGWPASVDVFSCTAQGKTWIQYEWLAQLAICGIYKISGTTGLVFSKAILAALAAVLLVFAARIRPNSSWTSAGIAVALAMMACSQRFFSRPETFTFAIAAGILLAVEQIRRGRRKYVFVPALLMVPWVNMHGAWPAGLAWMGLMAFGETVERRIRPGSALEKNVLKNLWIALALATAATLVNPYFIKIWHVPFALSSMPEVTRHIQEWQRPDLEHWMDPRHIGAYIFLAGFIISCKTFRVSDALLVLFFGILSLTAKRHVAICMLMTAPIAATQFSAIGRMFSRHLRRVMHMRYALAILVILICVPIALGGLDLKLFGIGVRDINVPIGAAEFLEEHNIDGNLYNAYIFGNYLMFARYPKNLVFIDGRVDMYGSEVIQLYNQVRRAEEGWQELLANYDVEACVLATEEGTETKLIEALEKNPRWALAYWDDNSAVYLLRDGKYAKIIEGLYIYSVRPDDLDTEMLQTREGFEQAMEDYRHKLAEDPRCARAMYGLAGCLDAQGQVEMGLELLKAAVEIRPEMPTIHYALGIMLYRAKRLPEAAEELQLALDYGAPAQSALMALSAVYRDSGKIAEALRAAAEATETDPNSWGAWSNLSIIAEADHDLPRALQAARNALAIRPNDPATQERVKRLEREMGVSR